MKSELISGIKRLAVVLAITGIVCATPSCSVFRPLADKKAEQLQKKREKQADKEYQKAKEEHLKRQAESTRLMMKEAKKEQKTANRIHRRSLWDQLFRRSCKRK